MGQALGEELAAEGVVSKAGRPLSRGALFHLLRNRVYRGEVTHKGQVYPGEQAAIVEEDLWAAVQERLASNGGERRGRRGAGPGRPALLLKVLYDGTGDRLTPTHAIRRGKRYHYYVSHRLITKGKRHAGDGLRVPAADLDRLVTGALLDRLGNVSSLRDLLREGDVLPKSLSEQQRLMRGAAELKEGWPKLDPAEQRALLHRLLRRVEVSEQAVTLQLSPADLLEVLLGTSTDGASRTSTSTLPALPSPPITLSVPAVLRRNGREMALVIGDQPPPAKRNPGLVRLLARAQALRDALLASSTDSLDAIAAREEVTKSYLTRLVRLAYLSPRIVAAILDGTAPAGLTPSRLMQDTRLPLLWAEQEQLLGLS